MSFVVSLLLAIPFLAGLGWLVGARLLSRDSSLTGIEKTALALTCGLSVNYGIILCAPSLGTSMIVGGLASAAGLATMFYFARRVSVRPRLFSFKNMALGAGIMVITGGYLVKILSEPLSSWDGRSIWFFHAKMIYAAGALNEAAGWSHPSLQFSHVDYPNLMPSLAAQFAYSSGYWNEYIPKAALLLLLIPALFWIFSFARFSWSFLVLLCIFPFSMGDLLWNGLMDGYLAFYFAVSLLLFGRFVARRRNFDLVAGLCCLLMLSHMKNEGALGVLAGMVAIGSVGAFRRAPWIAILRSHYLPLVAGVLPYIVWSACKSLWHLHNDLGIGSMESLTRMAGRLADGRSVRLILDAGSFVWVPAAILIILLLLFLVMERRVSRRCLPALLAGVLYYVGTVAVYLSTPYDLQWHVGSSIGRTLLPVVLAFWAGVILLIGEMEDGRALAAEARKEGDTIPAMP